MKLGAVIVAAGAGRRLGGVAKALLPRGGATYLAAIARAARDAELVDASLVDASLVDASLVDAIVVVGPPFGAQVAAHASELGLAVAENPAPERGMASSIAAGFAALIARGAAIDIDAAWLWPVDHPAVAAATLRQLCAAAGPDVDVVQPRYRGTGGHPPLIARALWPQLAACGDAPDGARGVLRAARSIAVEVDDPGVVRDVDTPADLAEAR